jgi:hypothetical protein
MPQIIEAVAFLDDWMTPEAFDDLGPNSLQVPAKRFGMEHVWVDLPNPV